MRQDETGGGAASAGARANLMRVEEVSERLGLSKPMVYAMMADGTLPYVHFGRARRVKAADVDALIERNTVSRKN